VFFDDRMVCTQPREQTNTWSPAHLYMTDPWHEPARASINNFKLTHLTPIAGCTDENACNYVVAAAIDDMSCQTPERGMDCENRRIGNVDGSGVTTFIGAGRGLLLAQKAMHAVVALPDDYTIAFTINPSITQNEGWGSIIHFSATGSNCCNYGDRVPAVWFRPGTRELYIIDGQPTNGDDACDVANPVTPNTDTRVEIAVHQLQVTVKVNGAIVCQEARQDRAIFPTVHVYASDPWHEPALATLSDFIMTQDTA
jgi:hypothetical protein